MRRVVIDTNVYIDWLNSQRHAAVVFQRSVYEDAGHVLRALQATRGYNVTGSPSLANDVLIALSARSIGAGVVTSNARDFAAIRGIRHFTLAVVSA